MDQFLGEIPRIDIAGLRGGTADPGRKGLVRVVDEVSHHPVLFELTDAVDQIPPHQVLGERECRDRSLFEYLEARDLAYCLPHSL